MRVSVTLPEDLSHQLEELRRREERSLSGIIREAVAGYLEQRQRRAVGDALQRAIAARPLSVDEARQALEELHRDRDRSDRV